MQTLRIVVPVLNDWTSFSLLLRELNEAAAALPVRISVCAVDDGSTDPVADTLNNLAALTALDRIEIVHLSVNLGHQRAIAVGLCLAVQDNDADAVLVMDADGEDSPHAIASLLQAARGRSNFCIVARRRKRRERLTFRLSYVLYKLTFKLLTARHIDFGNFCLLSRDYVRKLVRLSDMWNNLPAAVLRSRLPIDAVPVDRAPRYAGESKMSLTSLIIHGLSAISVYAESIFVRLILFTICLAGLAGIAIATVLTLRLFFPRHATPGWATTVSFGMIIILVQAFSVTLSSILILLNSRVQRQVVPIVEYALYIDFRETLMSRRMSDIPPDFPAAHAEGKPGES